MRVMKLAAVATAFAATAAVAQDHDHDAAVEGGGVIVEGWSARPDQGTLENLKFERMGSGFHVNVGPAVVLYRETDNASGQYEVSGTFTQTSSLGHAHSYGLFIGGSDLQGDGQAYTYFLVRGDGVYLVKKRDGEALEVLTQGGDRSGYVKNDAIHMENGDGQATNELAIRVRANDVQFVMNGTVVMTAPKSEVHTDGIAGMRINHNLDIEISAFQLNR